jgi:hypothetical protein
MRIAIYIIAAILTNYGFSYATSILVMAGFEKMGSDPGSPGIMLFSLMCICGVFSLVTAAIMEIGKAKYHIEFPAKFSALIFILTYFPFHIMGLYIPDEKLGSLAGPLGILFSISLFFSYIPLFQMTSQGLINLNEFLKRQVVAGNRHSKFFVLAFLGVIVLLLGWLIFKPETQTSTGVLSLQDNWQLLESSGQDWQSDAYLQSIWFYPNSRLTYEIYATYLSENAPEEIYSIEISKEGKVINKETRGITPMRESAKLPINIDDWKIESIQAWNIFMQIESVNSCLQPSEKKAFISLELHRIGSGKLAWDISIMGCSTVRDYSSYYLDAKTGETIESYFEK